MSHYVGVEMSDHLTSLKPRKQVKLGARAKVRKRRRASDVSRRRNRGR
jgi:hypothetical protein